VPEADDLMEEEWELMHDGAPSHRAYLIQHFLEDEDINTIPMPARSPDLNPLENV